MSNETRLREIVTDPDTSSVTAELCELLEQRDATGRKKYGVTLDRKDLTAERWAMHAVEELLDGAGYLVAMCREFSALRARCEGSEAALKAFTTRNEAAIISTLELVRVHAADDSAYLHIWALSELPRIEQALTALKETPRA